MAPSSGRSPQEGVAVLEHLSAELEQAKAQIERLTTEQADLRRKLGEQVDRGSSSAVVTRGAGGYRGPDVCAVLEKAITDANGTIANLSFDNSILQSRIREAEMARAETRRRTTKGLAAFGVITVFVGAFVWLGMTYGPSAQTGFGLLAPILVAIRFFARRPNKG